MSALSKLMGWPDINLNKLARGDKKEREKAAPVVAQIIEAALPLAYSEETKRWFDTAVSKLPVMAVEQLRDACNRRLNREQEL